MWFGLIRMAATNMYVWIHDIEVEVRSPSISPSAVNDYFLLVNASSMNLQQTEINITIGKSNVKLMNRTLLTMWFTKDTSCFV